MLLMLLLVKYFIFIFITLMTGSRITKAIQIPSQCPFANLQYPGPSPPMCMYAANNIRPSYAVRPGISPTYSTEYSFTGVIDSLLRKYGIQSGGGYDGVYGRLTTPALNDGRRFIQNVDDSVVGDAIKCGVPPVNCLNDTTNLYYRSVDGSCNNLLYPEYGMAATRYARLLRPNSDNSISSAYGVPLSVGSLPSARLLSLNLYGEQVYADKYRTMASMQWGQFVAHDLSMFATKGAPVDCCEARGHKRCNPIPLGQGDPIAYHTGRACLSFAYSISDAEANCPPSGLHYNEKINMVSAFLDLSSLYGSSNEQSNKVRLHKGGLLKTSYLNSQHFVPISSFDGSSNKDCGRHNECYLLPDIRNQLTPIIIVMHTLLMREHNRIATQLALINPHYNDEQLYQEARKISIGQYQKISYYDWLPLQVGHSYAYTTGLLYYPNHPSEYISDYDESVNSAPLAESSAAALRYCHTQVPGWFSLVSPNSYTNQTLRLSEYTDRANNVKMIPHESNFDSLVLGLAYQLQKLSDGNVDPEIKHYFFRKEFDEYGSDLKAIDIQRARDFKLPSYNDMRAFCGLPRATYWSGFANEITNKDIYGLQNIYATPDDVELSIGGSLERHVPGAVFGPTFLCIVGKQFLRTRIGDRFFFENGNKNGGFTREQLAELRKTSLASIFCNNANYLESIQSNVFVFPNARNPLLSCNQIPQIDLNKWQDNRY